MHYSEMNMNESAEMRNCCIVCILYHFCIACEHFHFLHWPLSSLSAVSSSECPILGCVPSSQAVTALKKCVDDLRFESSFCEG